jgi:t-SNARE complex subunit (syntaxin)
MKTSEKILCFIIVAVIFALITYVAFAVNNGNAGFHGGF